jgi:hypothetical protein
MKNNFEIRKKNIELAMPSIKKLVEQYGLNAVSACIYRLKASEKAREQLEIKKQEIVELEKKIN